MNKDQPNTSLMDHEMDRQHKHYAYIWEYEVIPGRKEEFMRAYGPAGAWAQLFARASGYIGTLFLNDQTSATRYLTIDRWSSAEAYDAFLAKFRSEYEDLDKICEAFTSHEANLGSYWECTLPL